MTPEGREVNHRARSFVGQVVGRSRYPGFVRIRRDGQKSADLWNEDTWQPLTTTEGDDGPTEAAK